MKRIFHNMLIHLLMVFGCLIFFPVTLSGQYATDNLKLSQNPMAWHDQTVGQSGLGIYEGVYYNLEQPPITPNSHIYYQSPNWQMGSIVFRGQAYDGINMTYDILNDILVVQNESVFPAQPIKLNQSQISSFSWGESRFQRIEDHPDLIFGSGFYQVLLQGDLISFIVKRKKKAQIVDAKAEYTDDSRYYLFFEGKYSIIKNRRVFYKTFPTLKKQLKTYIKVNRLYPSPGNDDHIKLLLKYCEKLMHP